MKHSILAALAIVLLAGTAAQATEICAPHDKAKWMSKEEMTAKVKALGYDVRKIEEEDGCWEVKGQKAGQRVEAYFDPVTAELVLSK